MKRGEGLTNRERFCKKAIENPKEAAKDLHAMADALSECRNTTDITFALSEIFCVSERTIFFDLKKKS